MICGLANENYGQCQTFSDSSNWSETFSFFSQWRTWWNHVLPKSASSCQGWAGRFLCWGIGPGESSSSDWRIVAVLLIGQAKHLLKHLNRAWPSDYRNKTKEMEMSGGLYQTELYISTKGSVCNCKEWTSFMKLL